MATNLGSNTVSVLLGTGGGSFAAKTDFTTGACPSGLAVGDVNGDRVPDLAIANNCAGSVSLLLGAGAGNFAPKTDLVTGAGAGSVAIGDVDGDGLVDLLAANYQDNTSPCCAGPATGRSAADRHRGGHTPFPLMLTDFHGDGAAIWCWPNSSPAPFPCS